MKITRRRSLGTIVLAGALAFGGALAASIPGWASASTWAKASCGLSSGQAWYQFR